MSVCPRDRESFPVAGSRGRERFPGQHTLIPWLLKLAPEHAPGGIRGGRGDPSQTLVYGHELPQRDEIIAAGFRCHILFRRAWVLAAAWRTEMVDRAAAEPIFIVTQKRAGVGEPAALPATVALAAAILGHG